MMTIRLFSQYVTLVINLIILISALASMYLQPNKRLSLAPWVLYGVIGVTFYVMVLFFGQRSLGGDLSPIRVLLQDSIVASVLFWVTFGDILNRWRRWKQ